MSSTKLFTFIICLLALSCGKSKTNDSFSYDTGNDWPVYGGDRAGNRYSPLNQINKDNVKDLEVAWVYDARDNKEDSLSNKGGSIQCQPIVVNGVLYGTSPELKLFAIDATTGEELWKFNPVVDGKRIPLNRSRGVTYWEKGNDHRILYSAGSNLYAVNSETGELLKTFGDNGIVDLHTGLVDDPKIDVFKSTINATSPGVIYNDVFVIGSTVGEGGNALPGHIRAFDVVSGKLKWVFHTVPHPGELGYDTWPKDAYKSVGGANSWGGMSVDVARGLVYLGTGSPSSDFYGGEREGKNLFGNCILALEAETGKLKWYFQTIHHDLWDRDSPSPPNLTTITQDGKTIDVVVQATKDGLIYVLDRDTGESVFPVEEVPVPTENALPGEHPWPTQKMPIKPAPLADLVFTEDHITDLSPESHAYVKDIFDQYTGSEHRYTPPTEQGTIMMGYSGGAEWGGNATDKDGILYQNSNNEPWILEMVNFETRNREMGSVSKGKAQYTLNCAVCHGEDRKGVGIQFPSLINIGDKLSAREIGSIIWNGSGFMPPFQDLDEIQIRQIITYLLDLPSNTNKDAVDEDKKTSSVSLVPVRDSTEFGFQPKYISKKWRRLLDQDGYPGIKRPWGTLNAIDLNTGDYLWRVPLGEYPELAEKGIPTTGTDNYGGPIVTASGLIFIAGTKDEKIRAFDKETGEVVWEYQLPAGGFATPATYSIDGKQYIAIAVGGGRGQKVGGYYMGFALPD